MNAILQKADEYLNKGRSALQSLVDRPYGYFFLGLIFTIAAFSVHYHIFYFEYRMDDALTIANYLQDNIHTIFGFRYGFIFETYISQWEKQGRFGGIVPIIRIIQANLFGPDMAFYYATNIFVHTLNALLGVYFLHRVLKLNLIISTIAMLFFLLNLDYRYGLFGATIWNGSNYMPRLTALLVGLITIYNYSDRPRTRRYYGAYGFYFAMLVGPLDSVITIPIVLLFSYHIHQNIKLTIKDSWLWLMPAFISLFGYAIAPSGTYSGTKMNTSIALILEKWQEIIARVVFLPHVPTILFWIMLAAIIVFLLIKNRDSLFIYFIIIGLIAAIPFLYGSSIKNNLQNYFIYHTLFGFYALMTMIVSGILERKPNHIQFQRGVTLLFILLLLFYTVGGAKRSKGYLHNRRFKSERINSLRDTFYSIEKAVASPDGKLIAIYMDRGYFDIVHVSKINDLYNAWRSNDDHNSYIVATKYKANPGDPGKLQLYTDFNSSIFATKSKGDGNFVSLEELAARYNQTAEDALVVCARENAPLRSFQVLPIQEINKCSLGTAGIPKERKRPPKKRRKPPQAH